MVYHFGDGQADGTANDRELLGGKGANLAEMCLLGVPVPPGFTITTKVCTGFYDNDDAYPDGLEADVADAVGWVGEKVSAGFGAFRRSGVHARHDGYRVEPRSQ